MANTPAFGSKNIVSNVIESSSDVSRQKLTGMYSDLASNGKAVTNVLQRDGKITQSERLFSARARYGATALQESGGSNKGGSRGQWSYIKLLTSQSQYKDYLSGAKNRDLTYKELVGSGSEVAKMADPTDENASGYDKFLLTSISCSMSEKVQISEVFGDSEVVYYFGRQPLIFNISGLLVDSADNNWFVTWLKMYSDFLRGSQAAKNYELIKIVLPNMAITGSISGFSWNQDGNRDVDIPFNFQFIAKIVEPIATTNEGMVTSNRLASVDFSKAYGFVGQANINSLKGQLASLTSTIQDPASSLRDKGAALTSLGSGLGGTFGSYMATSNTAISNVSQTVEGWNKASVAYINGIKANALYQTVTSSLNGIRTNLFSPIYGVLSSLTKLVSNVFNAANSVINGLISPVRNILRDITNISKKAVALVNLVNSSVRGFGRNIVSELRGVKADYKAALKAVKNAAGVIGSSPKSAAHTVSNMFSSSVLSASAPFLQTSSKLTFTRPTLSGTSSKPKSKISLLKGVSSYAASSSNSL